MGLTKVSGDVIQTTINVGVVTATTINVGSAVTIHTGGFQIGSSDIHSTGISIRNINSTGVITATSFVGNVTGNVNSTGVSTLSTLRVGTGGTIITTTTGGSVGVGTTNPAGTLHVETSSYPTIKIQNTSTATGFPILQLIDQTTNGRSFQIENGRYSGAINIRDNTTGVDRVTLNSSGNLGIGITNPSNRMHLYSTSDGAELLQLEIGGQPANTQKGSIIWRATQTNGQSAKLAILGSSAVSGWGGELFFSTKPNNGTPNDTVVERVRINASGNVGIGTDNPQTLLHTQITSTASVNGTVANSYPISRFINLSSDTGARGLEIGAPTGSVTSPVYLKVSGTGNRFAILNQSNSESFTVLDSGNTGIGTNNPSAKLDVEDNTSSGYIAEFRQKHPSNSAQILIDSPTNGESRPVSIDMSRAGVLQWSLGQAYNDTNQSFHIATSAVQSGNTGAKLTIKTNGDVGIGTFNPAYKLDVRGDVLTYGLRILTDLTNQTDTGNITSSATNLSYKRYGGVQSYTASVTCNNTWYTLIPNFNDTSGYIIVTAGDASSKNVQEYMFMTTSPAYGVSSFVQLHNHGAWNTGSFELQVSSSGSNLILQARATSYYSSSNISSIYMKIISNY